VTKISAVVNDGCTAVTELRPRAMKDKGRFPMCRSASKLDPPSARDSAKPSGATLRCAPPALALRPHNLEGGQLFDADPGQMFGAV
jgi:hypothetical protein